MLRQISIHEADQKYQLILARRIHPSYQDLSAENSYLWDGVLTISRQSRRVQQIIKDEGSNHPLAAQALQQQLYVDDALIGADPGEEANTTTSTRNDQLMWFWAEKLVIEQHSPPRSYPGRSPWDTSALSDARTTLLQRPRPIVSSIPRNLSLIQLQKSMAQLVGLLLCFCGPNKALMQHLWTLGLQWVELLPIQISQFNT